MTPRTTLLDDEDALKVLEIPPIFTIHHHSAEEGQSIAATGLYSFPLSNECKLVVGGLETGEKEEENLSEGELGTVAKEADSEVFPCEKTKSEQIEGVQHGNLHDPVESAALSPGNVGSENAQIGIVA